MDMNKIIKRYNNIMYEQCLDHLTVHPEDESGTEAKGWNLRDMVSECQYQLDLHYQDQSSIGDMRYSDDPYERKQWKSEVGKLQRFINRYKDNIQDLKCIIGHCSKWD